MPAQYEYTAVRENLGAFRVLPKGYRWQTALELQTDRCQDGQEVLQSEYFWLPHGNVFYQKAGGKQLMWGFTDQARNLILKPRYIDEALVQLPATEIFRPKGKESWCAIEHKSTQKFSYAQLRLTDENGEWSYFLVTRDLSGEREMAARAVGFNSDNVNYLLGKGLRPRVCLPNPEYLKKVFSGTEEDAKDPIWRASWLGSSGFSTVVRDIGDNLHVRGVRRRRPQGDAPEKAVPSVAVAPQERSEVIVTSLTMEEILTLSRPYVPECGWTQWNEDLRKKFKPKKYTKKH